MTEATSATVRNLTSEMSPGVFVGMAHQLSRRTSPDFPVGDPRWGRLQLTPDAHELWQSVIADEPLGTLGRGAITAKRPQGSTKTAAANGLCG